MIPRVRRTLLHGRGRTVASILAVSAAITLVLVFEGFRGGLYRSVREFPASLPAPLIAMQAGVSNVLGARSVLPKSARAEIEAVPGVRTAHPLGGVPAIYSRDALSAPIYVVAYDTAGGPRRLVAGHGIAAPNEIVVDATMARRYRVGPGDDVEFLGHPFRIAGLSSGTANVFGAYAFARYDDLVDLYLSGDVPEELASSALSFLLVDVDPGHDLPTVRVAIEHAVTSVDVYTPAEVGEHDVRRARTFMDPPLSLLIAVSWIVALLVVGLTLYASVLGRLGDFGVMKAIGARDRLLGRLVIAEAVTLSSVGFVAAVGWTLGLAAILQATVPEYPVEPFDPFILLRTAGATLVAACAGAVAPIARIARVEPAAVFAGSPC